MGKIIMLICLLFMVPTDMEVAEIEKMPEVNFYGIDYQFIEASADEAISKDTVLNEVYWLQESLPILQRVNYSIHIVNEKCIRDSTTTILGLSDLDNMEIYMFATPDDMIDNKCANYIKMVATEHTAAHEIGHLLRHDILSDEALLNYYKMRGGGIEGLDSLTEPDEVFAEDFAYLFGSPNAFPVNFGNILFEAPGEKEKEWIANNLTLGFYEKYPLEQMREAMGLP